MNAPRTPSAAQTTKALGAALITASPLPDGVANPDAMTARAGASRFVAGRSLGQRNHAPASMAVGDLFDGTADAVSPVTKQLLRGSPGQDRGVAPAARRCRGVSPMEHRARLKAERKSQRRRGDPRLVSPTESAARSPLRSAIMLLALGLAAQLHEDRAVADGAHDLAVDELVRAFDESPDLLALGARVERLAPRRFVAKGLREGWLQQTGATS